MQILPDKKEYSIDEVIGLNVGFKVVGGLRESFTPDVWTVAWEENDKLVRLTMQTVVAAKRGRLFSREVASTGKQVRKAKFYWSRDPDLPFRIWSAIIPEDGGRPLLPASVDEAKSTFLDVVKRLELPASLLGRGRRALAGMASVSWSRRSYIEKGKASGRSKEVQVTVD